jgi:hypothetical protein
MLVILVVVLGSITQLGAPGAGATVRSAAPLPATLTVSPNAGVPGQTMTLQLSNFITSTQIVVQFVQGSAHFTLASFSLNLSQDIQFNSFVPLAATAGPSTIVACYSSTNDCTGVATAAFAAFNVLLPSTTLSPNPALTGSMVTLSGTNFGAGETVSVTIDSAFAFTRTTDSGSNPGSFSGTFTALSSGTYTVTATGLSTGIVVISQLTVLQPTATVTPAPPTATGTPQPTSTATATPVAPTATSTLAPAPTSTTGPTTTPVVVPTATPCPGPGNSGAAHCCPRGSHGVHGRCVRDAVHVVVVVVVKHPVVRHKVVVHPIVIVHKGGNGNGGHGPGHGHGKHGDH